MDVTITGGAAEMELEDVRVLYGEREALSGLSLRLPSGGVTGLIGPNGAGKTTLLRVLSGVLSPTDGRVLIRGRPMDEMSRRGLSRLLAAVPQSVDIPVAYTVGELVALGRTPYLAGWQRSSAEDVSAVRRALEMADLVGFQDRLVEELSAGERQRALVAMALAQEPAILLLDEPTAHLDVQHAWHLAEIISHLNRERGVTVVMSLHDLNLASEFCSDLVLLDRGRLVRRGPAAEVLEASELSRVYAHPVDVVSLDAGRRVVVPRRQIHQGE